MARFRRIYDDPAILPREEPGPEPGPDNGTTAPNQSTLLSTTISNPTATGASTSLAISVDSPAPTATTATSSTILVNTSRLDPTNTASGNGTAATAASSTSAAAATDPNTIRLIEEIVPPIAFVIILIPIIYMIWIRRKTRNMNKLESEPRHSPSPSKELKFRAASPGPAPAPVPARRSLKQSFLPPLFHEQGSAKGPSLFSEEVRASMESTRQKESGSIFDRPREDLGAKDNSYNVYAMRRDLEDKGRADSIGLFDLPRSSPRSSPAQPAQRVPSPTLPSPKAPLFERPPSEAWPLPAAKLPEPTALYDPYISTKKSKPGQPSPSGSPPPSMPLPTPPASRQENQTNSFASSNLLPSHPPSQQFRPSSSGGLSFRERSAMGSGVHQQHLSGSTAVTSDQDHLAPSTQHLNVDPLVSPSSVYNTPATATFNSLAHGEPRGRHRDSDLVSELSYRSPSAEREQKRQSSDAISVVSAISHRRRRSERDVDTLSMVSALSPETDDTPRIPIEHYPLT